MCRPKRARQKNRRFGRGTPFSLEHNLSAYIIWQPILQIANMLKQTIHLYFKTRRLGPGMEIPYTFELLKGVEMWFRRCRRFLHPPMGLNGLQAQIIEPGHARRCCGLLRLRNQRFERCVRDLQFRMQPAQLVSDLCGRRAGQG